MNSFHVPLANLVSWSRVYPDGIGIEVEYEGYRCLSNTHMWHNWSVTGDGSLRDRGVEFVSHPLPGEDGVTRAMDELRAGRGTAFEAAPSFRCGIHVHLSMQSATVGQFLAFCTLYAIMEPVLMQYCGEERQDNIFCVPWYHTPAQLGGLVRFGQAALAGNVRSMIWLGGGNKYQGCNFLPMSTFGTVELRMAPTWDNIDDVQAWVMIAHRMRTAAFHYGTPAAVLAAYEADGLAGLAEEIGLETSVTAVDYEEEALDLAYALVGQEPITAEEIQWDLPNTVLGQDGAVTPYQAQVWDHFQGGGPAGNRPRRWMMDELNVDSNSGDD